MKIHIIIVILFLNMVNYVNAQPELQWERTYGGQDGDWGHSIIALENEGYLLVGTTASYALHDNSWYYWVAKTDHRGDIAWSRAYGGDGLSSGNDCISTLNNEFAIAGYTDSFGNGNFDMWLLKINEDGDSLWSSTFGGEFSDGCNSLINTADGGFAMCGWTQISDDAGWDFYLVKSDSLGNEMWSKSYGGDGEESCFSLIQLEDRGFVLGGYTSSFGSGNSDMWLLRTDENGDSLWSRTFGGEEFEACFSLTQISQDFIIMAGVTESYGSGESDAWVVKSNIDGDSLWSRELGGLDDDVVWEIIETNDNGFALTGRTNSIGVGRADSWIVKLDENGDSLWYQSFGDLNDDLCTSIVQNADDSYTIFGNTKPVDDEILWDDFDQFWLIRTDSDPNLIGYENRLSLPQKFYMYPSYPNPFNSISNINFLLPKAMKITLKISDTLGRNLKTLIDGEEKAGNHTKTVDLSYMQSGTYFIILESTSEFLTQEIILIK